MQISQFHRSKATKKKDSFPLFPLRCGRLSSRSSSLSVSHPLLYFPLSLILSGSTTWVLPSLVPESLGQSVPQLLVDVIERKDRWLGLQREFTSERSFGPSHILFYYVPAIFEKSSVPSGPGAFSSALYSVQHYNEQPHSVFELVSSEGA